ncbi:PEP/pyruvate-binding domain-containing protein [Aureispira anguillae]|uniref:Phosphoenolpyruvate synthase n=1 Tax=Aureispira anguillae TaxID=2864201 RepID=A0A916DS04_9BACT|nr:PEP/pyruvate-binding domain-containing protein [Aureispira anguillae]BDS10511.1 PEP/pyruvate-binding domain-containing protein [Aureispira anguillae]
MKKDSFLIHCFFISLFFCGKILAQNEYNAKDYQFISYDKIPTWKVIVADWDQSEPSVHLFDTERYKGHGNYVCYGMKTGLRFPQFKELVRHPSHRVYLPVFLYDLRKMPMVIEGETYTWAVRLEHYDYTDDPYSMEQTFVRLMKTMEKYIRKQAGNIGRGIALLASSSAALPNKTIRKGLEQQGYQTMALYELIAALEKSPQEAITPTKNKEQSFAAKLLNTGIAVGYLKWIKTGEENKVTSNFKNILLYESLPYRVPIANGIITIEPQTPLSHINLLAKNRGTINAYLQAKLPQDFLQKYGNKLVKIIAKKENGKDALEIELISEREAQEHWKNQRKLRVKIPKPDLSVASFSHFELGARTVQTVNCIGAKAANYAWLQHELPEYTRPGFAIPFYFYFKTVKSCGADQLIESLLKDQFKLSSKALNKRLESIRNRILTASLDERIYRELELIGEKYYKGKRVRLRSSTNCEDLADFNGAGLYVSKGFQQGCERKVVQEKILKVYASLWLSRAFEERAFFGIDHRQAAMAILINEAFPQEYANGVALTIPNPTGTPSIHINTQYGEVSVTNPKDASRPEIIYFRQLDSKWYVTESKSSLQNIFVDNPLLTPLVRQLQKACAEIDASLRKKLINPENYGVDVEFKIMKKGAVFKLYIKQARLLNTVLPE